MKNRIISFLILIILLSSCGNAYNSIEIDNLSDMPNVEQANYDVEILYTYQIDTIVNNPLNFEDYYSKDSVYLIFETLFDDNNILIKADKRVVFNSKITTNSSTGTAKQINVGNIKSLKDIQISINNGPLIYIDMYYKDVNIIGVRYVGKKVKVLLYREMPFYD